MAKGEHRERWQKGESIKRVNELRNLMLIVVDSCRYVLLQHHFC